MYQRTVLYTVLVASYALLAGASTSFAGNALTDEQIRQKIVEQSLLSYPGNCPCPYNVDRAGRRCGKRSAWSRPGGYTPVCFTTEVSEAQVRAYRVRSGA